VEAVRIREAQPPEPDTPDRNPIDVVADFSHGLRSLLRRGPIPEWSHDLATLVLIEATNSMRRALRLRHGIEVELRISLDSGQQIEFRNEALRELAREKTADEDTSSENLEEADALPS
jgi:hypothetical protein